jgi:hypothetical protein
VTGVDEDFLRELREVRRVRRIANVVLTCKDEDVCCR